MDFETRNVGYGDVSFPLANIKSMNVSDSFFCFVTKDGCHHFDIGVKNAKNFFDAASQAAAGKLMEEQQEMAGGHKQFPEKLKLKSEVPQVNYTVLNFALRLWATVAPTLIAAIKLPV